ncbi:hypothetical protein [Mycolicibacterium sediminis]|nr:hypothetical protein [Mycolicibacterium sediminis]
MPIRLSLTAGMAIMTAATLITVSTPEPALMAPLSSPPVVLTAVPQTSALPYLVRQTLVPPSADAPLPTLQLSPVTSASSIDSAIKNAYDFIEPWVRYGFEVATYAVGWVPVVGWLAPQIMIVYDFGERIVRSIVFNVADWLGGQTTFINGLTNVVVDTVNSFIQLANDELAFWLPPLPPIPPIGGSTAASDGSVVNARSGAPAPPTDPAERDTAPQSVDRGPGILATPVSVVDDLDATPLAAPPGSDTTGTPGAARTRTATTSASGDVRAQGVVRPSPSTSNSALGAPAATRTSRTDATPSAESTSMPEVGPPEAGPNTGRHGRDATRAE